MKYKLSIVITLLFFLIPIDTFALDATGMWNYTESNPSDNCPVHYVPEIGKIGLLQEGSTFLIVGDNYSTEGIVVSENNNDIYTFSDQWNDSYAGTPVHISSQSSITLTSLTAGSGPTTFTATWTGGSCSGSFTTSVSRTAPVSPVYDATGRWNYQLYISPRVGNYCDAGPTTNGYFDVTQTGNKVTAVDDQANEFKGFVNGNQYGLFRTYSEGGGRTTEWSLIDLRSSTESWYSDAGIVWDDDDNYCRGDWNIYMNKEVYSIYAYAGAGGSISPSGDTPIESGSSQGYEITPDSGYIISDVVVDESSVGAVSSYMFNDVSGFHTISAYFELDVQACESLIIQDFNAGAVPPSGWQLLTTNQDYTWKPSLEVTTGDYSALVEWDYLQDELLLSQQLSIKEAILHFWSSGSTYYCRDDFDNCDLEIWIVVDGWDAGSGDDIFVGKADNDWIDLEWTDSSFNLTSMLPDKPIRIGFRYKGDYGDDVYLDDVQICSDKPAVRFLPFLNLLLE